jgi:hypothetical protein
MHCRTKQLADSTCDEKISKLGLRCEIQCRTPQHADKTCDESVSELYLRYEIHCRTKQLADKTCDESVSELGLRYEMHFRTKRFAAAELNCREHRLFWPKRKNRITISPDTIQERDNGALRGARRARTCGRQVNASRIHTYMHAYIQAEKRQRGKSNTYIHTYLQATERRARMRDVATDKHSDGPLQEPCATPTAREPRKAHR